MVNSIAHRGPDGAGIWTDMQGQVALGHRRLAVVELSDAGRQPMTSHNGRYVIVFNGEIYNHLELRRRLDSHRLAAPTAWRGHSDTETLLECICAWGLGAALKAAVGMFALALWDRRDGSLSLARDRMGEKPLFFGWQAGVFLFGSELKALRAHPAFAAATNPAAAAAFLRFNFVPAPHSIYAGIHKLLPGTVLTLTARDLSCGETPAVQPYWSLTEAALRGVAEPFAGSFEAAVDRLEELIGEAVRLQSMADVPVGAFLSGGVDSSLVVALMKSAPGARVMTFSIGMPEAGLDESEHAARVAAHLGTQHIAHQLQAREALDLIPRLHEIWDEPLGDSSQIPTFIVSRLARRHVTVSLSGDGGDELFLGYTRHLTVQRLWQQRRLGRLPWSGALAMLQPLDGIPAVRQFRRRVRTAAQGWRQPDAVRLSRFWSDRYRQQPVPLRGAPDAETMAVPVLPDVASSAALWDACTYLPDDILVKVDRAAMANSLETRAPLLDHRVVEFALSLPEHYKMSDGQQKRVLKALLYRHVPQPLVDRPKMGFAIPLAQWLRTDLKAWAGDLVQGIERDGFYDKAVIERIWTEHQQGHDHTERLWGVLSLLMAGVRT